MPRLPLGPLPRYPCHAPIRRRVPPAPRVTIRNLRAAGAGIGTDPCLEDRLVAENAHGARPGGSADRCGAHVIQRGCVSSPGSCAASPGARSRSAASPVTRSSVASRSCCWLAADRSNDWRELLTYRRLHASSRPRSCTAQRKRRVLPRLPAGPSREPTNLGKPLEPG